MQILDLTLHRYKRLALNEFETITLRCVQALQLILGTNGSGKSSLFRALIQLVPERKDFLPGGRKEQRVLHQGKLYTLKADFSHGQKYYLEVDGRVLNDWGTRPVQVEEVRKAFGLTPRWEQLILGKERFTLMDSTKRKEWFLELSPTSYEFALKVYGHLKALHRDALGTLKNTKARLVEETKKLMDQGTVAQLQADTARLHEHLSALLEQRRPVDEEPEMLAAQGEDVNQLIRRHARQLRQLHQFVQAEAAQAPARSVEELQQCVAASQALLSQASAEFASNQHKLDVLRRAEQQTSADLSRQMGEALRERNALQAQSILEVLLPDPQAARQAFDACRSTLSEIFSTLPDNPEGLYSSAKLAQARLDLAQAKLSLEQHLEKYREWQAKLRHLLEHQAHPNAQCPNCEHRFSLQYNAQEHQQLETQSVALNDKINAELQPRVQALERYVQDCSEYAQLYRHYVTTLQSTPMLQPYWDYLAQCDVVPRAPRSGHAALLAIEQDLQRQAQCAQLTTQIRQKEQLLHELQNTGGVSLQQAVQRHDELSALINTHTSALAQASQELKRVQALRKAQQDFELLRGKLLELLRERQRLGRAELEAVRRVHYNLVVRQLSSLLASKEQALQHHQVQQGIVRHIEGSIAEYELDERALSAAVKQLSPHEGLVAEGLYGFINHFIAQMNAFIERVWMYPLTLQSFVNDGTSALDLDYKFPVTVAKKTNQIDDVKDGSDGMVDIIDLAFRVVALHSSGLEVPLFLDEFGRSFDEAHRGQATQVIKALYEQHIFKQLFVISHDAFVHGGLSNLDICVLNPNNITVPSGRKINEHVVLQ